MNDKRDLIREMYSKAIGASDLDWSEIAEQSGCG